MNLALLALFAYLMGGIPFGMIVAKLTLGIDIRSIGSGNIGATNVLRVMGWKGGVLVLFLDALKGFVPVLLAQLFFAAPGAAVLAGLAAMLGHTFSPFLRFRGGRGVATGLGVVLALSWQAGLTAFGIALVLMAAFRYVSLGSVVGALSLPFLMIIFWQPLEYVGFVTLAALLIVARHIPNMRRLLAGAESQLGEKSAAPIPPETSQPAAE